MDTNQMQMPYLCLQIWIQIRCKYCTCAFIYQYKWDANTMLVLANTNRNQRLDLPCWASFTSGLGSPAYCRPPPQSVHKALFNNTVWTQIQGWLKNIHKYKYKANTTKHCQRHNGPEGWVHLIEVTSWSHITSSNTNLNQIHLQNLDKASAKNLKIQNLDQT